MINIRIEGLSRVLSAMSTLKKGVKTTLSEGMREAAFLVERYSKIQISTGKNRAIKTGYLRSSIGVMSVSPYRAVIQAGAYYGRFIHDGTRYMRPRPFMKAGTKDAIPEIEKMFGKRIKTLVKTI